MRTVGHIQVFCSYSHRDRDLRDELVKYLYLLQESLLIRMWHDGEITPGQDWQREIKDQLAGSDVILLLVSIDFLNSEFVKTYELPLALRRHENREALVIPVLLRPVPWTLSGLSFLEALPKDLRPVIDWSPPDSAFVNICEGLFAAVLAWQARTLPPEFRRPHRSTNVRRRVVDLAISRRVPMGKATILAVMVRRVGEHGLRAILEVDDRYGLRAEDVESTGSVPLEFPRRANGQLSPLDLTIAVVSGDFRCQAPRKDLSVPPRGDSPICVFLLEALHAGVLRLTVEVSCRGSIILTHVVRSEGVPDAPFEPGVEEVPGFETHDEDEGGGGTMEFYVPPAPFALPAPAPPQHEPSGVSQPGHRRRVIVATTIGSLLVSCAMAWFANESFKKSIQQERRIPRIHAPLPPAAPGFAFERSKPAPRPDSQQFGAPTKPYDPCQVTVGGNEVGRPESLTLRQIANGLGVSCEYGIANKAFQITVRWQMAGRTVSDTSETVESGRPLHLGSDFSYDGPIEPGRVTVTVSIVHPDTGLAALPRWTASVQLTR